MQTCWSPWWRIMQSILRLSSFRIPPPLELEGFESPRMEHFFHSHQAGREALQMVVTQKCFKRFSVGGNTVGPEVLPHQRPRFHQPLLDERQRDLRRRRVTE